MSATNLSTALCKPLPRAKGLIHESIYLKPSLAIACAKTTVLVVPSQASLFVFSAASLTISAHTFSTLSSSSISLATLTPSFVTVGAPKPLSKTTFLPFGHIVTLTTFATVSTHFKSCFLASSA
jgi:hypothetical protein